MSALQVESRTWIARANARPIGTSEFRHVRLEIGEGWHCRTLAIRTLRHTVGLASRTVFCVMEPWGFRNVNYVVREHKGRMDPFVIELFMPFGLSSLRAVESSRRGDTFLGSDFSYDDFRTWLYEEGHEYGEAEAVGGLIRVGGRCVERPHLVRHRTAPFDVWLDAGSAFVHGIDFRSADGSGVVREYRAEEKSEVDGILVAGRMTMLDYARNHRTTLHLERAWYDRGIDETIFEPAQRRHTRDYLSTL